MTSENLPIMAIMENARGCCRIRIVCFKCKYSIEYNM